MLNPVVFLALSALWFSKVVGKFSIMQIEHLSIKYSKKMDFRLKRDIAAIRNNCVITTFAEFSFEFTLKANYYGN